MKNMYKLSGRRILLAVLFLFVWETAAIPQPSGDDGALPFPGEDFNLYYEFGGLKPDIDYEVWLDGYFLGMRRSSEFGRIGMNLYPDNHHVEIREYIHAESSVENWTSYE